MYQTCRCPRVSDFAYALADDICDRSGYGPETAQLRLVVNALAVIAGDDHVRTADEVWVRNYALGALRSAAAGVWVVA